MNQLDFLLKNANRTLSNMKIFLFLIVVFSTFSVAVTAQNFTLTSNTDTHATSPTTSALDGSGQITLRSAVEAATQIAGTHVITIPGSITTINLSLGQMTLGSSAAGNNITINGPGKTALTINQTTASRIFSTGLGAVTVSINGMTMNYAGPAGTISGGGGCILSGGVNANTTITNVAITNFNIQIGNGGALSCSTSNTNNFTMTNCDFTNNMCGGGGGAVSVNTNSTAVITNCRFINNSTGNLGANTGGSGGAMNTTGSGNGGVYTVTNCTFINNQQTTNSYGGAISNNNGTLNVNFCRFIGNTAATAGNGNTLSQAGGASVQTINAENNWWGVNSGPTGIDAVVLAAGGSITLTKWLQLKTSIATNPLCTGNNTTVTADFLSNSASEGLTAGNVAHLAGLPISFANPTLGSLSGAQATIQNSGIATVTFTAGGTAGTGSVNAVVDNVPTNDVAPARVSFTINPGAAVTGNPSNTTVCAGANVSFTASFSGTPTPTIQWQVSTNGGSVYNNIAGATSSPLTFATVAGNTGNLYRAVGTNTCGSTNTTGALLTVNTSPSVTANPSNTSVPAGNNASFTASFSGSPTTTLQWQVSTNGGGSYTNIAGATSSPLVFTTNLSQSGNLYRCAGTNICNSATTTSALLTVTNACATSSVISESGTSGICAGSSANIKVTITGGASPYTVVYNDGTNNFSVPGYINGTNISVSPATNTSYTLVSVTDANSCVGSGNSGTATITVNPAINAGITNNSGSTVLTCSLTAISVTATGGTSYLWDGGSTPNTATNSFSSPGTYHVTVTGAGGCNAPAQINITQNTTPPTAGITNNSGSTVLTCLLTSVSVTATGGISYSWDGGATPNAATNSFSSPGTYTVTVTSPDGCSSQSQIIITQNITPPTAGINNNTGTTQLDCSVTSVSVTATGGVSYSWDGGSTPNTAANSFNSPGTYTVTVTGANGCTSQAQIMITQSVAPPTADITNNTGSTELTCSLTSISVTATGGVNYSWDGGSTPNTAANSFSSAGTYTVTVTAAGGCTAQAQIVITQNVAPPTAGITNNTGTTQLGCGVTSINVTATGGVSYSWNGGATPNTANNSFNATGTYTVIVTGANGCTSQAQITISNSPGTPAAPGPFTGLVNVCVYVGTGTQLTYSVPAVSGNTYSWVVPSTVTIVSGQGTNSIVVTLGAGFAGNPNKQLRVTATNACGTSPLAIYYLLTQTPTTPASITATGVNVCPVIGTANTYTYTIPSVNGASSYLWIAQSGTTTVNHPNSGVNDTTITVSFANGFTTSNITVQSVNGCGTSNPRSITITANAPTAPSPVTGPTNACEFIAPNGVPATYSVINNAGATYNWTVPLNVIGLTGQGTNSISFTYPNGFTSGTISVTSTNGCGTGPSRSLNITRLVPGTLSQIDIIQTASCPDRTFSYSVAAIPANATSVQWTVPAASGAVLLSGQGTRSITVSYPSNAVTGSITATAVSNCANSGTRTSNVRLSACPIAPPPPPGPRSAKEKEITWDAKTIQVTLFPNPTVSDFKLQVSAAGKETIHVRITDMQGRTFKSLIIMPDQTINVGADLKAGAYLLEVKQGNNTKITRVIKF